jgi:hypothetical protein
MGEEEVAVAGEAGMRAASSALVLKFEFFTFHFSF